jgi:hypothetical protein
MCLQLAASALSLHDFIEFLVLYEPCRLAAAVKGGEGAPDLAESVTNLGVNVAALAVLSALVARDLQAREKAAKVTSREEELGRLLVSHL